MTEQASDTGLVEVRVVGLPLDVWSRAQEHIDGLLREFSLLLAGEASASEPRTPQKLLDLIQELEAEYAGITTEQADQIQTAFTSARPTIDLTYRLPPEVARACRRLEEALDEADDYCRSGQYLLTLATPPEALAFRQWFLGQFVDQIDAKPARSWDEWIAASG
ncbi:MAG: hypothetical protein ACYDEN_02255 [Acidimicrobiales bacterium]